MEIMIISIICAMIVTNVGANHCSPFNDNSVNIQGVLGESIHMQCDITSKLCDKVLWKKKSSESHLNDTGCNNGYCIHHSTDKSVLELPQISPDNCGSYECLCYRSQPETFLVSCFELSAVCQMRIILPGDILIHNNSVSSGQIDDKTIDIKPEDRHKIECQDKAEHFTSCIPSDDGTFTVPESEKDCWHLCSLPLNDVIETCDVWVSLRVQQTHGKRSLQYSDNSLGYVHGERVKRDMGMGTTGETTTAKTTVTNSSDTSKVNSESPVTNEPTATNSEKQTNGTATNDTHSTMSIKTTLRVQSTSTSESTSTPEMKMTVTTEDRQTSSPSIAMKPSNSSNGSLTLTSILNDCASLSIFIAIVSFIVSLMALIVAMGCCCYACFSFKHTGTATITSTVAGKEEIALEGVTVKEIKSEDEEDVEKGNQEEAKESASPAEPPVTASVVEPSAPIVSSEPTVSPEPTVSTEPVVSSEPVVAPIPAEAQEQSGTGAIAGDATVSENHVVNDIIQPEINDSPKETEQNANNVKETAASENQNKTDAECPEML